MFWLKKHADSIAVISAVVLAVWWMTSQINGLRTELSREMTEIQKDVAVIKTVLIMNGMMSKELAVRDK